jgi:hypothetical protein
LKIFHYRYLPCDTIDSDTIPKKIQKNMNWGRWWMLSICWTYLFLQNSEANSVGKILLMSPHLIFLNVIAEKTKIDTLITDNNVKGMILSILLKLTEYGIVRVRTVIMERVCICPHFECKWCVGHIEKCYVDRYWLTQRLIQPKTRTSSIVTRWAICGCVDTDSIKIVVQILQCVIKTPENMNR